jgi:hypothetical protein
VLEELLKPENFGSYILEITSWENDGDHYNTELEFSKDSTLERFEALRLASQNLPFTVSGIEFKNLQEVADSEATDSNGHYISDYFLDSIGYGYESSIARTVDSVKMYFLDSSGKLEKLS